MFNETLIIIPARKGSVGLPGKNMKELNGKPLIKHTFDFVNQYLGELPALVTSDSTEILDLANRCGIQHNGPRPDYLSNATSKTIDVVKHELKFIDHSQIQRILLLQPTSPLRVKPDLIQMQGLLKRFPDQSIVSVTQVDEPHPYKMFVADDEVIKPLIANSTDMPRQTLPIVYFLNGMYYLINKTALLENNSFTPPKCLPLFIESDRSVNINNQLDFDLCEILMKKNRYV